MSLPCQRTESDSAITRSETWLRDGNVVLQAANTQFRVHWSVLSLNSSVFRDIEGLPQPFGEPTVDGCPVVKVEDDPADVDYLLKALLHSVRTLTSSLVDQKLLQLQVAGAFVRLGRKYEFKDLFDSAMARFAFEFPTTLEEYDTMPAGMTTIQSYAGVTFDVITLFSENHIFSTLPFAYFCVLQTFDSGEVFDGIERADGTLASLSQVDLRRCLVGRGKLLFKQFQPGYTLGWALKWVFSDCARPSRCRVSREDVVTTYLDDVLGALVLPVNIDHSGFCAACTRHIEECMAAGRKKMWEELPGIFDLPPWNELKNEM
ncbi:BTB domain-containing protein [Mycena sanguinolenta]|uniref:BTB domain-containing protein n=1 Tax=Mycena sanguinolenta TaxID=230812 RepID=A0A8H6Z0A8_9AGAR|nr:BTB domain-containing protein [Mycena sanguinolenta]